MNVEQGYQNHLNFNFGFVRASILFALTAGFAIAAHLSFTIGYDYELSDGFYAFIQIHGHTQLLGWIGLLIMGISLHFIPRLSHSPIRHTSSLRRILILISTGLSLRILAGSFLPYLEIAGFYYYLTSFFVALSAFLELAGIFFYLFTMISVIKNSLKLSDAFNDVKPFILMVFSGFLLYGLMNLALVTHMIIIADAVLDQNWNEILTSVFLNMIILPISFVFSIRLFPLFFTVKPIKKSAKFLGYSYGILILANIILKFARMSGLGNDLTKLLSLLDGAAVSALIIYLTLSLQILKLPSLNRLFKKDQVNLIPTESENWYLAQKWSNRSIKTAYIWLLISALLDIYSRLQFFFGYEVDIGIDAVRHLQLLGFATTLVFGVGSKMIPGFIGSKGIYSGKLAAFVYWFILTAVVFRTVPLLLPYEFVEIIPHGESIMIHMFSLSGIIGMFAIALFGWNLRQTHQTIR